MAVALDASTPTPVYATTAATASISTASFTPPAGSIVVAKVLTSDGALVPNTPTGLTFTSRYNAGTNGTSTRVACFTATGAGSAVTVTASFNGSSNQGRVLVVEVWTGAQLAATPATNTLNRSTNPSAPSSTLTTTGTSSVVTWICGDWSGTSGASRAYRSSAVETGYVTASGAFTAYTAYQAAAAAGSQTYGLTAPTQNWELGAMEIQASAATVVPRRRFVGQAMNRSTNF